MKLFIFFLLLGCFSEESKTYSRSEIMEMAKAGDPDLSIVIPKSIAHSTVKCSDYKPQCRYGYRVIVKQLEMAVLFYEKPADALEAAKRIRGYTARNWVLDDVRGEPVLERFALKYLKAEPAF